jgi:hypothetical protein
MVVWTRTIKDPITGKRRLRNAREREELQAHCNKPPKTVAWGKPRLASGLPDAGTPHSAAPSPAAETLPGVPPSE